MESSTFVSDAEMLRYISASYTDLYDQLVRSDPERYRKEQTFTGDGSTTKFAVESDYYGTIDISYDTDQSGRSSLRRAYGSEMNKYRGNQTAVAGVWAPVYNTTTPSTEKIELLPTPNSGDTYTHTYIVAPADLTTAADVVNGISGWEEYIVIDCAIKCRTKEETPTGDLERALERFTKRLQEMRYNRDAANAGHIINTRGDDREGFYWDYFTHYRYW
jgi:hypothetical protein